MKTLARLIGLEGEVVKELMINGCPPRVMVPFISRKNWVRAFTDPTASVNVRVIAYECEFVVEGDPIMATYRRVRE